MQDRDKKRGYKWDEQRPPKLKAGVDDRSTSEVELKLKQLEAEIQKEKQNLSPAQQGYEFEPDDDYSHSDDKEGGGGNHWLFWSLVLLTVLVSKMPFAEILFMPLTQFTTMIHEMGHAVACILTGGQVTGMTIVPDGAGHGGLTFSQGGIRFIVAQAGYLGTALIGCLLVYLGQFRKLARPVLIAIGLIMAAGTLIFMGSGLLSASMFQAFLSILWGLVLSGAIIWAGLKLKDTAANVVLLILAINTALDSVRSIGVVIAASMVMSGVKSDATTMQMMTGIPALVWACIWALVSMALLALTIWSAYGSKVLKLPQKTGKGISGFIR